MDVETQRLLKGSSLNSLGKWEIKWRKI